MGGRLGKGCLTPWSEEAYAGMGAGLSASSAGLGLGPGTYIFFLAPFFPPFESPLFFPTAIPPSALGLTEVR